MTGADREDAAPVSVQTSLRVRYAETDAMGVAHHAVYPVWFEVGRSDLMRALGLSYREVEERGFYLMLSGLSVEYRRAARYDDALLLTTTLGELRSRTLSFRYGLRLEGEAADGKGAPLVASGETRHIATDHRYRPARLPDDVLALLGSGARAGAGAGAGATLPGK